MTSSSREHHPAEPVAIVLGNDASLPIAEALVAAAVVAYPYGSAAEAEKAWRCGRDPRPVAALFHAADPDTASAANWLQNQVQAPALLAVHETAAAASALVLIRAGFYDCLPLPLDTDTTVAVVRQALLARRTYCRRVEDRAGTIDALGAVAEAEGLEQAATAALGWLGRGQAALVVAGRVWPGGTVEPWIGRIRAALEDGQPASLAADELPAGLSGALRASAIALAPGVWLIRPGPEGAQPTGPERLLGTILALVGELGPLRAEFGPAERGQVAALAALGRAALGVHHEINNPLCAIGLNAQLLAAHPALSADPALVERLQAIEDNTRRIRDAVRGLAAARAAIARPRQPVGTL